MSDESKVSTGENAEVSSWSEIQAYLEAHHQNVAAFGDALLRFDVDRDGTPVAFGARCLTARADDVSFDRGGATLGVRSGEESWIGLSLKICPVEQLRARPALVANSDLPIGALAVVRDWAVLDQTLPIGDLRVSQLEHTLQSLADMGLQLRAAAEGGDHPYAYVFR